MFLQGKNEQMYAGTVTLLPVLGPSHPRCPRLLLSSYLKVMRMEEGFLNCRIAVRKGKQLSKPWEKLGYTTSLENLQELVKRMGIETKVSEKLFNVSSVTEVFNQGMTLEDAMFHGQWKSLDTPQVYCSQN